MTAERTAGAPAIDGFIHDPGIRSVATGRQALEPSDAFASYEGMTVAAARTQLAATLREARRADAREDARRLVAHALGVEPGRLAFELDRVLTREEAGRLAAFERERLDGRTVARILGHRPFHDITLAVSDDVLEPRDDTAALVELALPFVRATCERRGVARVLDCGVGAGTVVLAILTAEPRARGVGMDVSVAALALASRNAASLGLDDRFSSRRRDMLTQLGDPEDAPYDVIVSNPPYIGTEDIDGLLDEAKADPREALDGGPDGLRFYRALARLAGRYLTPDGVMAFEIGAGQGPDVRAIMDEHRWREVGAMRDLGGHERALAFALPVPTRDGRGQTTE